MTNRIRLTTLLVILLFVASCSNENKSGMEEDLEAHTPIEIDTIANSNNKLGFHLLDRLELDESDNLLVSPTSALMALLLAYNGASGDTKEEIADALSIVDMSNEQINEANKDLINRLEKESDVMQISVANSIWINDRFHFAKEFLQKADEYFHAEHEEIDVNNAASVDRINYWVKEATNEKIEEIIQPPLDANTVAILINALYFNGKWTYEFDKENTEPGIFNSTDKKHEVPFMVMEEVLDYLETDTFQAVKLPYGEGELNMQIFLPKENVSMQEMLKEMKMENWEEWQSEFKETNGVIKLPKFEIDYETKLNDSLIQLGIEKAFDNNEADFTALIQEEEPLWIHEIKQKTYINVDEEGTEAAAVTSVEIRTTSAIIDDDFYMDVNRPFLFTIKDEESDVILFIGMINQPKQKT